MCDSYMRRIFCCFFSLSLVMLCAVRIVSMAIAFVSSVQIVFTAMRLYVAEIICIMRSISLGWTIRSVAFLCAPSSFGPTFNCTSDCRNAAPKGIWHHIRAPITKKCAWKKNIVISDLIECVQNIEAHNATQPQARNAIGSNQCEIIKYLKGKTERTERAKQQQKNHEITTI